MSDDSGDRAAYRDSALKILVWSATGAGAYAVTWAGNPRQDTQLVAWALLLACAVAATVGITSLGHRREERDEMARRMDAQDAKLDLLTTALQCNIRSDLAHRAEKYLHRGWLTVEEHKSWSDAYGAYSELGLNGYMASYMHRLDALPLKELDEAIEGIGGTE